MNDVLAHLRACGDVWGGHIAAILAEDRPRRSGVNPRTYLKTTDYPEQPFDTSFRAYREQREALLEVLRGLSAEQWARTATVKAWGGLLEHSVLFYADALARHESSHVRQIERTAEAVRAV